MTETEKKNTIEKLETENHLIECEIDHYLEMTSRGEKEETTETLETLFSLFDEQAKLLQKLIDERHDEKNKARKLKERFLTAQAIAENLERYQKIRRITFGFRD